MRHTLTSVLALGLAAGMAGPVLAQQDPLAPDEGAQPFVEAGFTDARPLRHAEVARVTDDEGNTYFVIGGLFQPLDRLAPDQAASSPAQAPQEVEPDPEIQAEPAIPDPDVAPDPDLAEDPQAPDADPDVAAAPDDLEADPEIAADPQLPDPDVEAGPDVAVDPLAPDADPDVAADPAAPQPDVAAIGATLEDHLAEAGIADFEIVGGARIAEVVVGEGDGLSIFVVTGIETGAD